MPLRADALSFAYTPGKPVLQEVSLSFEPGRITAILGPNGAGKSTLLRLLLGLLEPGQGRVDLDGSPPSALPASQRACRLAYIPQRHSVAFAFTVASVVGFGAYANPTSERVILQALKHVDLEGLAEAPFYTLSAGQQQRAVVARALVQAARHVLAGSPTNAATAIGGEGAQASYILADEPVSAMDAPHAIRTMEILRSTTRAGGVSESAGAVGVLVVLHDLTLAARWADDAVLFASDGRVAARGPAREVIEPSRLQGVFGVEFDRVETRHGPVIATAGGTKAQTS